MEAIGQLAGGVAHDFNNMLAVILGHTELAIEQTDPTLPLHADLEEIQKARKRSADLTRQLLAFARKQTVMPKVLDLNETVEGMLISLPTTACSTRGCTSSKSHSPSKIWLPGSGRRCTMNEVLLYESHRCQPS